MPKGWKPEAEASGVIGSSLPLVSDPAIAGKLKAMLIGDRVYDS